jgi:hypothetical protein
MLENPGTARQEHFFRFHLAPVRDDSDLETVVSSHREPLTPPA